MQLGSRWTLALAALVSLATVSSARALLVAVPGPNPTRGAQADAVVVGRVVALEPKDIEVAGPGGAKTTYRIAVVNVTDSIVGVKGVKAIRVGFIPTPMGPDGGPAVRPIIRPGIGRFPGNVNLEVGQDGLFFLTKHAKEDFFTTPMPFDFVQRTAPEFDKQIADVKKIAKALENPMESLKTGSAEERLTTASLLITKYRQVTYPSGKTEPIAAEESKLILKAILDGNWGPMISRPGVGPVNSLNLFYQLGVTAKDGWTPKAGVSPQDAAKEWLTRNWETYRIQRMIAGEPGGAIRGPGVILPVDPAVPLPRPVPLPINKLKLKLKVDRE